MLTIVSKHNPFLKSARDVFAGYPDVRFVCSYDMCDPSGKTAYVLPSDPYGMVYGRYRVPDMQYQTHIDSIWKEPMCPDSPIWYSFQSVYYIVAPCLRVGLAPYYKGTCAPYLALRSVCFVGLTQHMDTIICPTLGVDPGDLDPELASMQMCQAWNDSIIYIADTVPQQYVDPILVQKLLDISGQL